MTFDESVEINADVAALFRLSQDYRRRLEWDPFLSSARLVGDAREAGVGIRAHCVAKNGLSMETEYVTFNPPSATAIQRTPGPMVPQKLRRLLAIRRSGAGTESRRVPIQPPHSAQLAVGAAHPDCPSDLRARHARKAVGAEASR
jgi:hypothetical protein